jgi:hypothetical protein
LLCGQDGVLQDKQCVLPSGRQIGLLPKREEVLRRTKSLLFGSQVLFGRSRLLRRSEGML